MNVLASGWLFLFFGKLELTPHSFKLGLYSVMSKQPSIHNSQFLLSKVFSYSAENCEKSYFRTEASYVCYGDLTVIIRWTEGVIGHSPTWGKDDKISNGYTWSSGFGSQHSKDGWIL